MSAAPWSLVTYLSPGRPGPRTGVLTAAGTVHPAPGPLADTPLTDLLARWERVSGTLRDWRPEDAEPVPGAELLAPLRYPGTVLCSGANYYGHLDEMHVERRDPPAEAYFFLKTPRTTVIGPGAEIPYPAGPGRLLDWEAELAVVVGRSGKGFSPDEALGHVAGYTIANDVSARDALRRDDAVGPPFQYDWLRAKSLDGFCPLGPGIVPAWFVDDPQELGIRLSVNGEVKQDSSTKDMIRPVCELLSIAARDMTLLPGDVVLTGSPAGVGLARGEFLAPGDEIVIEIERLGRLHNTVGPAPAE
ncbi:MULTISPECIES: fumarylacetoacetate hydrolase family protein [Streptomyces]|uniref:fumarylacetoacetate hydrolase family protein n=1 Tax=Streptomyces TaxID=1883 RepID=UPI001C8EB2A2|nr:MULTISPECIES: fumarylacetoacetate hydrolase family protein [Streptomyces]UBI35929.1 fumarylacetoacetate hydrolase family protein [Streptomyces mobaraensis]UKW28522.1 fumarylacetoacetate hydrolase family protein [Streptomyces sp. TYQ1024]